MYHEELTISAPTEEAQQPTIEREKVEHLLNPASARILAKTVKRSALDPDATLQPDKTDKYKTLFIKDRTPEDLKFRPVQALSEDSRRANQKQEEEEERLEAETKGEEYKPKTLEERKQAWTKDTAKWIKDHAEEAPDQDEFQSALKALDLDDMDNLSAKVDGFYKKYLDGKSDIKTFVEDLAHDLKDADGSVDLGKLETRLNAAKGLFSAFGRKDDVHELVADYAIGYGMLAQNETNKQVVVESTLPHLSQPVPEGSARLRLEALHRKNEELEASPPGTESPKNFEPTHIQDIGLPTTEPAHHEPETQPAEKPEEEHRHIQDIKLPGKPMEVPLSEARPMGDEHLHADPLAEVFTATLPIEENKPTADAQKSEEPEDFAHIQDIKFDTDDNRESPLGKKVPLKQPKGVDTVYLPGDGPQQSEARPDERVAEEVEQPYQVTVTPAPFNRTEEAQASEAGKPMNQLLSEPDNGSFGKLPDTTGVSVKTPPFEQEKEPEKTDGVISAPLLENVQETVDEQPEPSNATTDETPAEQEHNFHVGQKLTYMESYPGEIIEIQGQKAKIKLENGHNLDTDIEKLQNENWFQLETPDEK